MYEVALRLQDQMINHTTTGTAIVRDERRRRRLGSIAFKAQAPITRVVLGDGRSVPLPDLTPILSPNTRKRKTVNVMWYIGCMVLGHLGGLATGRADMYRLLADYPEVAHDFNTRMDQKRANDLWKELYWFQNGGPSGQAILGLEPEVAATFQRNHLRRRRMNWDQFMKMVRIEEAKKALGWAEKKGERGGEGEEEWERQGQAGMDGGMDGEVDGKGMGEREGWGEKRSGREWELWMLGFGEDMSNFKNEMSFF